MAKNEVNLAVIEIDGGGFTRTDFPSKRMRINHNSIKNFEVQTLRFYFEFSGKCEFGEFKAETYGEQPRSRLRAN